MKTICSGFDKNVCGECRHGEPHVLGLCKFSGNCMKREITVSCVPVFVANDFFGDDDK